MHQCWFYPDSKFQCQNTANRQVWIRYGDDGDITEKYIWVCNACLPNALAFWTEMGHRIEF
jgi:hypothetical protein